MAQIASTASVENNTGRHRELSMVLSYPKFILPPSGDSQAWARKLHLHPNTFHYFSIRTFAIEYPRVFEHEGPARTSRKASLVAPTLSLLCSRLQGPAARLRRKRGSS